MLGQMPALNSRNVSVARTIHKVPVGFIARKYLLSVLPNLMRLWASKIESSLTLHKPRGPRVTPRAGPARTASSTDIFGKPFVSPGAEKHSNNKSLAAF